MFAWELAERDFLFSAFLAGAVTNAIPGIVLQVILIPILVTLIENFGMVRQKKKETAETQDTESVK